MPLTQVSSLCHSSVVRMCASSWLKKPALTWECNSLFVFLFGYSFILIMCPCVGLCTRVLVTETRGHWVPWSWSYRKLVNQPPWVLEVKHDSSARAAQAFNSKALLQPIVSWFLKKNIIEVRVSSLNLLFHMCFLFKIVKIPSRKFWGIVFRYQLIQMFKCINLCTFTIW